MGTPEEVTDKELSYISNTKKIQTKDLKKNITYYLHFGFYGYGGRAVKVVRVLTEPRCDKDSVVVSDSNGGEYLIHKNACLFAEDPLANKDND